MAIRLVVFVSLILFNLLLVNNILGAKSDALDESAYKKPHRLSTEIPHNNFNSSIHPVPRLFNKAGKKKHSHQKHHNIEYCMKIEKLRMFGARTWDDYGGMVSHYAVVSVSDSHDKKKLQRDFKFQSQDGDTIDIDFGEEFCWLNPKFTSLDVKIELLSSHYSGTSYECLTVSNTAPVNADTKGKKHKLHKIKKRSFKQYTLTFDGTSHDACSVSSMELIYSDAIGKISKSKFKKSNDHYGAVEQKIPSSHSSDPMNAFMILTATICGILGLVLLIGVIIWSYRTYTRSGYDKIKSNQISLRDIDPLQKQTKNLNPENNSQYSSFGFP